MFESLYFSLRDRNINIAKAVLLWTRTGCMFIYFIGKRFMERFILKNKCSVQSFEDLCSELPNFRFLYKVIQF